LSGIIAAVGSGVTEFTPGDQIFGVTNPRFTGAYAEYAIAGAGMIAKKPASLTHVDAASVPVVAVTAWQALFEEAHLEQGAKVLIHGAAGNVGAYAVQLARAAGLHVTATSFARDIAYVRSLGADNVIDVEAERFEDVVGKVDACIDLVGGETQARSLVLYRTESRRASGFRRVCARREKGNGTRGHCALLPGQGHDPLFEPHRGVDRPGPVTHQCHDRAALGSGPRSARDARRRAPAARREDRAERAVSL
jgi:hypothetical protein